MYSNTSAEIRPDLQSAVEEAVRADTYFLHEILVPTKFTSRNTGEFHKITKTASGILDADLGASTLRAPKAGYKKVNRSYAKDNFLTFDRGLEEDIDDSEARKTAPSFSMEQVATRACVRNVRFAQEKRVADLLQDTTQLANANGSVAYTEANITNDTIDFALDLQAAIATVEGKGEIVTDCVIPRKVFDRLRRSVKLRKYMFGDNSGGSMITSKTLSDAFDGMIRFHIAKAVYNGAKKGQAFSTSDIWSTAGIFIGSLVTDAGTEALQEGEIATFQSGLAVNFVWEQDATGLYVTETYRREDIRSDVVRVRQNNVEKYINKDCGYVLNTQYA